MLLLPHLDQVVQKVMEEKVEKLVEVLRFPLEVEVVVHHPQVVVVKEPLSHHCLQSVLLENLNLEKEDRGIAEEKASNLLVRMLKEFFFSIFDAALLIKEYKVIKSEILNYFLCGLVALCRTARNHVIRWGSIVLQALLWFLHLLSDILSLSSHLIWNISSPKSGASKKRSSSIGSSVPRWRICAWIFRLWKGSIKWCWKTNWKFRSWLGRRGWWGGVEGSFEDWDHDEDEDSDGVPFGREKSGNRKARGKFGFHHPGSLECNISLPSTGEEAMKRLLACKGKDPYRKKFSLDLFSIDILGVTPNCSDDDVKKYYKRQAFLVHPDKNGQPGAEEAFKILVHAFDLIGEPEKRLAYDRRVVETRQAEHAWSEFSDLLSQLQEKMAEAANTISFEYRQARCTNCGKRHRRISVPRPCYAARLCSQCKIHHAAREGDIWAESSMFGFLWHYYACMEGAIYDITEWATCQGDNLRHLRPNSHNVQYRILLGKRGTNGGNGGGSSPTAPGGGPSHSSNNSRPARSSESPSEPDLDHFLNNLYSGGGMGGNSDSSLRQEQSRKRKGKRKK
ncbi:hypothetical protein J437_LFUL001936 [Ladona fulva]|uniref:J domain-containing protein n=1 Tax=Ladona fulva TaxID=123851 RepID=A0A8K0NX72_LADFU|nr:hypothetical protein J437_LFUL001936 [Ladona fulva]